MNRTLIAMVAVAMGALVPMPTVDAYNIEEGCALEGLSLGPSIDENGEVCLITCPNGNPGVDAFGQKTCTKDTTTIEVGLCDDGQVGLVAQRREVCMTTPDAIDPCLISVLCADGSDLPQKPPYCTETDDDPDIGGTHVSCKYSCASKSVLAIGVVANDPHAGTYGNTECGGADAACMLAGPACSDTSDGLTTRAEDNAVCDGYTDEFNSSPALVACSAIGLGYVCDVTGLLCEERSTSSTAAFQTCFDSNPWLDAALGVDLRALQELIPDGVVSFIAFVVDHVQVVAMRFDQVATPFGTVATCIGEITPRA